MPLTDFLLSTLASLIASALFVGAITFLSKSFRGALTLVAASFLHVDVKFVFSNTKEAETEIKRTITKATTIRVFTSRGNEFQRDMYSPLLQSDVTKRIKILLPSPAIQEKQRKDWIEQREQELAKFDRSFGLGSLRSQIEMNIKFLMPHLRPEYFELRLYDFPHFGRVILTEQYLFLTPYKENLHGRNSVVIQHGRGDTYDMFNRLFDMIWDSADHIEISVEKDYEAQHH